MSKPDEPIDLADKERLAELARTRLMEGAAEERFDRITRLAARALMVPVALISVVDYQRQFFKSAIGLLEPWASSRETPLTHSFCQHVVTSDAALRIEDARIHPLVRENLAVADLGVVAYLGVPFRAPTGHVLGSLCAIDGRPRAWSDEDERVLRDLAVMVEDQIGFAVSEKRMREILDTMPQMVWSTLPDGHHDFYNRRWYEYTGVPYGSTDGAGWNEMFHPDDRERAWSRWRQSLATGDPYEIEYRLRHHSGDYRWTLGRALPIRDPLGAIERWFGTCTDIHDLKMAEAGRDLITRELSHRIQNIFAVVNGIVSLSARNRPDAKDLASEVSGRIAALAKAHRYVDVAKAPTDCPSRDYDQTLKSLLATVLAPYESEGRIEISGADAGLDLSVASALALILHELATNSVKYGALSRRDGTLSVNCAVREGAMCIVWRETGGPEPARAGEGTGFGTRFVELMARQLRSTISRRWEDEGLTVELVVPETNFKPAG